MTKTRDLADLGGGFIQAGTGAEQRPVESKLKDVVSVKDFGAEGDGATNDAPAIQQALNTVGSSKTLYFPPGNYRIESPIDLPSSCHIKGAGRQATRISTGMATSQISITSLSHSAGTATATTASAHGFSTGDVITIYGADQKGYNGDVKITVTSTTQFTYAVDSNLTSPTTGTIYARYGNRYGLGIVRNQGDSPAYNVIIEDLNIWGNQNRLDALLKFSFNRAEGLSSGANFIIRNVDLSGNKEGSALYMHNCIYFTLDTVRAFPGSSAINDYGFYFDGLYASKVDNANLNSFEVANILVYRCASITLTNSNLYSEAETSTTNRLLWVLSSYRNVFANLILEALTASNVAQSIEIGEQSGTQTTDNLFYAISDVGIPAAKTYCVAFNPSGGGVVSKTTFENCKFIYATTSDFYLNNVSDLAVNNSVQLQSYEDSTLRELTYTRAGGTTTKAYDALATSRLKGGSSVFANGSSRLNLHAWEGTQDAIARFQGDRSTSSGSASILSVYVDDGTGLVERLRFEAAGAVRPGADNTQSLGTAARRWSEVFAGAPAINTSDEREKQDIESLSDAELRVATALKGLIKKFRFKDAVQTKGDNARIHVGVIAQEVIAAFQAEGIDPMRYGIVCYDQWDAEVDENGVEISPAGARYGIRYEELLAFIIAAL